ncbi:hypothetical protein ANMWB30_23140 [Arthrobacter sp. MWB30]|nr:hypothetical protein ANMWB30_23140 [Arthrobacter sp. MWB30]
MFFGKKNQGADESNAAAETAPADEGVTVATKRRKAHELLSSVVKESTVGAAVALMRKNEPFALPSGKSWVVLGLVAKNIGGLSMKQKNDEAKGSIIELINADNITTVATSYMLEQDTFGIIPTPETLARMDEFSLLKKAEYLWVVLTQTDDGRLTEDPVATASYDEAVAVSTGKTSLASLLPDIWSWGGGNTDAATTRDEAPAAEDALVESYAEKPASIDEPLGDSVIGDDGFGQENPFGDDPIDYDDLADEGTDPAGDDFDGDDEDFDGPMVPDEDESGPEVSPDAVEAGGDGDKVFDESEVRATIARRFLSAELDLEVDLTEFEANFNTSAPVITLPVNDGSSDWLDRGLGQLARQGNAELEMLHANNFHQLRELFVSLASQHVEKVIADVSPDRPGSYYYDLTKAAKDDLNKRQAEGPEEVAAQRRDLIARYEAEAEARGKQAAEQAVLRYKEQNRPRHEREIAELSLANERASEELYDGARQIILDLRRKEAHSRMDLGMTQILGLLMEQQQGHRDAEMALLQSWNERLTEFLDANRKDDVARSEALAEQLSRENQVENLKAEHAARVQELEAEQKVRVEALTTEMQKHKADALADLTAREEAWNHTLSLEKVKTDAAEGRVSQLVAQLEQLGPAIEEQYTRRIETLTAQKEFNDTVWDRSSKVQARSTKILVLMILVGAIAALAAGFILGSSMGGVHAAAAITDLWGGVGDATAVV